MAVRDDTVGGILFGKTRGAVLGLLYRRPGETFHLREIARQVGVGAGPVQREMVKLAAAGLVEREQRGRQVFYQVNRRSPVYAELRGLVVKTVGAGEVSREAPEPVREPLEDVVML